MEKTIVFDNNDNGGNNGMMGLIASLCSQRGLDPNMVAALMNNRGNNDGFGNSAWWIIILLIFGWGGFGNGFGGGFGGRGSAQGLADLGNLVNNDAGRELLMSAIQGNGNAISQLASTVHCDQNALMGALQNLSTQLCTIGNQVGMSGQQVINAIQQGNCQLGNQLAQCCCSIQDAITRTNYENQISNLNQTNQIMGQLNFNNASVERGFASTNYAFADQTCQLKNEIASLKQYIGDQFCQDRMDQMARENRDLRDQVQAFQLSASQQTQTSNIINQLRPCPQPAYWVPNPFGCGCNNFGYPYNGNNGGCCNNGNNCGC